MTTPRGESPASPASRILLVEDVLEQREPVLELLRGKGFSVDVACDGAAAVREATRHPYDVIVMDIALPIMDGIDAMKRIRSGSSKRPYIIVLSAQIDARTRELAFEAGCDQYIVKPCGIVAIAAAVEAYFSKRDGTSSPIAHRTEPDES